MLDYRGLRTELMFFKGAIEKYGLDVQIIRGSGNDFKSAVEPFMYNKMSDENRFQLKSILTTLWNNMNQDVGESRNITKNTSTSRIQVKTQVVIIMNFKHK